MPPAKPKTVRSDLGEVITAVFTREWLEDFADQVKNMTRSVAGQGRCPECGSMKQVYVQIPDLKGQLAALTELMEQAEGKPGTASGEPGGVTIIVERKWPDGGAADRYQLHDAAEAGGVPPLASEDPRLRRSDDGREESSVMRGVLPSST